ncbi:MAG: hotdog fold thioesterase [Chitinophagaceae bacterium]|nr:MAG: hotdog fold thioesterase [Chitinophagaceae bacterium]
MIWHNKKISVGDLSSMGKDNMAGWLGIEFVDLGADYLKGSMPVDHRTLQPYGLLHGGASCVLAETLGSIGSSLVIDTDHFICVGIEINANHIKSAREGFVTGTAKPIHLGSSTHVWEIRINNEKGALICISRLTVAILPRKKEKVD